MASSWLNPSAAEVTSRVMRRLPRGIRRYQGARLTGTARGVWRQPLWPPRSPAAAAPPWRRFRRGNDVCWERSGCNGTHCGALTDPTPRLDAIEAEISSVPAGESPRVTFLTCRRRADGPGIDRRAGRLPFDHREIPREGGADVDC